MEVKKYKPKNIPRMLEDTLERQRSNKEGTEKLQEGSRGHRTNSSSDTRKLPRNRSGTRL
jgi:hypothetical protein